VSFEVVTQGPIKPNVAAPTTADVVGASLTSASTISAVTGYHPVTGTATVLTINAPYSAFRGPIRFLSVNGFSLTTGGNVGTAALVPAGQVAELQYDGTTWWPVGSAGSGLPSQGGHAGQFLTTNGTSPSWAAAATTLQTAYNLGMSGPQVIQEDATRLGVCIDMGGHVGAPPTGLGPNAAPSSCFGFAVYDSSLGSSFGQPQVTYFAVAGNGELIGQQYLSDSQKFSFRGDVATLFTSVSRTAEGADFFWYGGTGAHGVRGGGVGLWGGASAVPQVGDHSATGGYIEIDSGPDSGGNGAGGSGNAFGPNTFGDIAIGNNFAMFINIGNHNAESASAFATGGSVTRIAGGWDAGTLTGGVVVDSAGSLQMSATNKGFSLTGAGATCSVTATGQALNISAGAASAWSTTSGLLDVKGAAGIQLWQGASVLVDVGATNSGAFNLHSGVDLIAAGAATVKTQGGNLTLDGNGGLVFQVADANVADFDVSNAGFLSLAAGVGLFAAAGSAVFNLSNATGNFHFGTGDITYVGAAAKNVSIATAIDGTVLIQSGSTGANALTISDGRNAQLTMDESTGVQLAYATTTLTLNSAFVVVAGTGIIPASNNVLNVGNPTGNYMRAAAFYRYSTVDQVLNTSGAVTVTNDGGDNVILTATGTISSISLPTSNTYMGERLILIMKQDAGGTSLWPSTISNATLAGGSFTKTLLASAVDAIAFAWDSQVTKWREVGRAMNQS
jgi:hypothetical protein